jgi:CRP-like cAMP-binding protein
MTSSSQYIDRLLAQVSLFKALDEAQMAGVKETMRIFTLREGERLFDMGQPADRFFLVLEGQIKLYRVSVGGNEKIFEIVNAGQLFAEAAMFMVNRCYPVSATALKETKLCSFSNLAFLDLFHHSTDLCLRFMANLSRQLHAGLIEIDNLTLQNATFRVVSYLMELLPSAEVRQGAIELPAPKHIIASRLSIKPETFSRILHGLVEAGIVTIDGSSIHVRDPDRLRDYARLPSPFG